MLCNLFFWEKREEARNYKTLSSAYLIKEEQNAEGLNGMLVNELLVIM